MQKRTEQIARQRAMAGKRMNAERKARGLRISGFGRRNDGKMSNLQANATRSNTQGKA